MRVFKYYQVSNRQLFVMALMVGIISAALGMINTSVKEYFQLPEVTMTSDDKCVTVSSFKNGETYTCSDIGTILRNYRTKRT